MSDICELRHHHGIHAECDQDLCPYWRAIDHLDIAHGDYGCAIQYFGLLGERGSEISVWLLSVKERLDAIRESDAISASPLETIDPSASADGCQCSTS